GDRGRRSRRRHRRAGRRSREGWYRRSSGGAEGAGAIVRQPFEADSSWPARILTNYRPVRGASAVENDECVGAFNVREVRTRTAVRLESLTYYSWRRASIGSSLAAARAG